MKLYVDKDLNINTEKINLIGEFCAFCADHLPIKGEFKIYVISDRTKNNIYTIRHGTDTRHLALNCKLSNLLNSAENKIHRCGT